MANLKMFASISDNTGNGFDKIIKNFEKTKAVAEKTNTTIKKFANIKIKPIAVKIKDMATAKFVALKRKLSSITKGANQVKIKVKDYASKVVEKVHEKVKAIHKSVRKVPHLDIKDKISPKIDALKLKMHGFGGSLKSFSSNFKSVIGNIDFSKVSNQIDGLINKLGKGLVSAAKTAAAGIAAIGTAIGGVVTKSVMEYGNYEQLVGGVETIFGPKGAQSIEEYAKYVGKSTKDVEKEYASMVEAQEMVKKNADKAYMTAGVSANKYMETVTGFSASLIQSLGGDTKKAASLSDMALSDMADNANKMGTPIESIMWAYQGFAKQYYTMLDNLKLGYGGTKGEMERLLKDAGKIAGKTFDISSYSDIIEAIHIIQQNLAITGTTQKEAEKTITGSLNAMKAAWSNLLTAFVRGGDNLDECLKNIIKTAKTFAGNVLPAADKALTSILGLMGPTGESIQRIVDKFKALSKDSNKMGKLKETFNSLKRVVELFAQSFANLAEKFVDFATSDKTLDYIKKFCDFLTGNTKTIKNFTIAIIAMAGAFKTLKLIGSIKSKISSIFPKGGKGMSKGTASDGAAEAMTKPFRSFASIKTTTILKGMANMAIVLGGLTIMAAAIMAVAPKLAKLSDVKSLAELVGVMGVLGTVGAAMSVLAGKVGVIPVSKVALGLANIAIIVSGMTALFLVIGAASFLDFNFNKILQIIKILGILGTVSSAITLFAGAVGMIPTAVVLTGLANIALVLGGMTAIIVAFGALSKIRGFSEFISSGGDLLAKLFGQLGKIAGAVIGGIGEGVSSSLPTIGKNLSDFAESLKPMFAICNGVDVSGIGSFFSAIGGFLLKLTGINIASIFTGDSGLSTIGGELSTFASDSEEFFTKVANFPKTGFENAKLLFQSLADIGNVPNSGGIAQWFSGKNDFEGLASGLAELSSEDVFGFYSKVSGLPKEGFENAKALFQSLSDIGNIPNSGGIAQWFSGENDFEGLAEKLPPFGVAMAEFYNSIAGIEDFTKISQLFESLGEIGNVPNTGGIAQWFSGENDIEGLGKQLKQFGEDTKSFFSQINNLNIGKLNGLWNSLKKPGEISSSVLKTVDTNISQIVKKISELPKKMGEGLKGAGPSLTEGLVSIWKDAVVASATPVNKALDGANWVLKELGSEKRVASWTPYASGTNGHRGGNALVNDGRGAELIQLPNGKMFIPSGKNVFMPNAPKGMKVMTAENTASLMGKSSPTFNYADGTGLDIDVWDYLDNAEGLAQKIANSVSYEGLNSMASSLGKGIVNTAKGVMPSFFKKIFEESGGIGLAGYNPSKGVEQWRSTVIRALKMENLYSPANVARTLYQMQTESGGNPKAINLWDSNAKAGIPSKGLMQVIDPTFKSYARKGFDKNIWDPLSNILAAVRYAVSRYGSLARAFQGHGYANGGLVTKPGFIGEKGSEMVIPLSNSKKNRAFELWKKTGNMLGVGLESSTEGNDLDAKTLAMLLGYLNSKKSKNNNSGQKVYNFEGMIGNVIVQNEADEDRLIAKLRKLLQDEIFTGGDEVYD